MPKTELVTSRFTAPERVRVEAAAELRGLSRSEYVREACRRATNRDLADHRDEARPREESRDPDGRPS